MDAQQGEVSSESTHRSGLAGLPWPSGFLLVFGGFLPESLLGSEVFSTLVFRAVPFSSDTNTILGNKEAACEENCTFTLQKQRDLLQNESKQRFLKRLAQPYTQ